MFVYLAIKLLITFCELGRLWNTVMRQKNTLRSVPQWRTHFSVKNCLLLLITKIKIVKYIQKFLLENALENKAYIHRKWTIEEPQNIQQYCQKGYTPQEGWRVLRLQENRYTKPGIACVIKQGAARNYFKAGRGIITLKSKPKFSLPWRTWVKVLISICVKTILEKRGEWTWFICQMRVF